MRMVRTRVARTGVCVRACALRMGFVLRERTATAVPHYYARRARSHNALRTIVGIPLSGLEWFIHVDQLFS